MGNDLSAENEKLKELVSSLRKNNDESERTPTAEAPVIDQTAVNKLEAENQQLKALVTSSEKKIDAFGRKHDETSSNITEKLKENVSSDHEMVSNLAAENKRLKVPYHQNLKLSNAQSQNCSS